MTIFVRNFTKDALSEKAGLELRRKILFAYSKNTLEKIVLDFRGINLYTTIFFNASIGYFILKKMFMVLDNIDIVNISLVGKKTLEQVKKNATINNNKK